MDEQVEIVRAGEEHLQQIVRLAESRNLSTTDRTDTGATEGGFLVSAYTEADYRARLGTAEQFYVAVKGGEVLAFLLAYTSDQLEPDEWLNHRIKITLGGFLVIKQVCVARGAARLGIGSMLYYRVLEHWQESPVIAAVVNDPPNEASSRFHHKLGFQQSRGHQGSGPEERQGDVDVQNGRRGGLVACQNRRRSDLHRR
ncbi:GNAT family N-acetyltransferase [Streptomyces sp. NRRL F-5053]|uniref:GNAT family N-acetyltransferase n=1 Tax=Streptomyces sp. NRRL F-5053 TaxID=1463854 RepID=UPI001F2A80E7|nr:GNAT family N-acetyltransferase [Streptomyces sp. NRRL F-5053]